MPTSNTDLDIVTIVFGSTGKDTYILAYLTHTLY